MNQEVILACWTVEHSTHDYLDSLQVFALHAYTDIQTWPFRKPLLLRLVRIVEIFCLFSHW